MRARRPGGGAYALGVVLTLGCQSGIVDSGLRTDASHEQTADADPAAPDATPAADAAAVVPCEWDNPQPPPASVLWAAPLTMTGEQTLGGHGHDDGNGPVGFCSSPVQAGQPYYRLVAAGFETDADIGNDGDQGDDALPVDFWRNADTFTGFGESGGRVHIYIDIVDENGQLLNVVSAPELRIVREALGGLTEMLPLTSKPANEFQTNFNMTGGGTRFAISIAGASDKVHNLRLPVNHHVCYLLIFQRELH